ncbi:MAG TPA: hypothetical protein VKI17_11735, partial [Gemmataceae bacterium]|nr:hypothetical protein [Gemmataceae bacterium]
SWFTIFSPRIQHYTVGLEPAEPDWVPEAQSGKPNATTMVTWMGRLDAAGYGRGQSQGLFRRPYDYAENATGMAGVPIQVWSTKSFQSAWQAPLDPARALIRSDLHYANENPSSLVGSITSRLPVLLEDVYFFHDEKWHKLPSDDKDRSDLPPGIKRLTLDGQTIDRDAWQTTTASSVAGGKRGQLRTAGSLLRQAMFYEGHARGSSRNLSLRELDQAWRLPHKNELFVVGRIAGKEGPAEQMTTDKSSPTRLWLGSLPGPSQTRIPLNGTLYQETYVRMIIPIKPFKKN